MSLLKISESPVLASIFNTLASMNTKEDPSPIPYYASTYQDSLEMSRSEAQGKVQQVKTELAQELQQPNSQVVSELSKLNQKRQSQGKAALHWPSTVRQIESISQNSSLGSKEKKKQIEDLRKQLGLSKGEMKKCFTKPLEKIYRRAAEKLDEFKKQNLTQFKYELKIAEETFGKNSPQAAAIKQKQATFLRTLEPEQNKLSEQAHFYKNLYPSFLSRLGGFFKKIGSGILKAAATVGSFLKHIPIIGTIMERVVQPLKYLFTGKMGSFFKSLGSGILKTIGEFKSVLPFIPGIGPVASMIVRGVTGLVSKFHSSST